ncbi:hypothetical protein [Kibdelosporangium philippinense]|uniref:hypothetical protein n=1 Tax=Kibdelosporangium philippinense TaxID=211113 RepID=UPI0036092C75
MLRHLAEDADHEVREAVEESLGKRGIHRSVDSRYAPADVLGQPAHRCSAAAKPAG